jgi:archaeosine synthase beta-subunit
MNRPGFPALSDKWIVSMRGPRNKVDPRKPYAWLVEKERTAAGKIEDTAIIFLTNRECSCKCLMCDLWKNTTETNTPTGAIPGQIEWALSQMPPARHLKLYNSGSFFDRRSIPVEDYEKIASLVSHFETVIVESHPLFINENILVFRDMLKPQLEVALGLETVNPDILFRLNKRMTLKDFSKALNFLKVNKIPSRAFILLRPPFQSEEEGIEWAEKSIEFAFNEGAGCCTVIPVRAGNGAMEYLQENGHFTKPGIRSLEQVLEYGINLGKGRVFADLWDLRLFSDCPDCLEKRTDRMNIMNHTQTVPEKISCSCNK